MSLVLRPRQERYGTAAQWQFSNRILLLGEIGLDTTAQRIKIGNGFSDWNSLQYIDFTSSALLGLSFSGSATGVIGTFTAPSRLSVGLTVASGTVNSAAVQIETTSDSVPRGVFRYPQGAARWMALPTYGLPCRARLLSISGGGTLALSV